ncbi:pirin family protein [Nocardioides acrostichi]|uniref:Pirin family protein n=1 Tax=Nocardioides acrostichi TaxID=2784339 RepID=A0A930Y6K8_9ACTN|nr:pirin family protein [Nocardioides acrostichi]MBF4161092.1 pirin family protein [Nocardioides acrostichi]
MGRQTRHAFSFGEHYDPERLSFGAVVCHDEHVLGDGRGFDTHRHSGLEIVTVVLSGALRHRDSSGTDTVLSAGSAALLSAGAGVEHSEHAVGPTRFVQVWLTGDDPDAAPAYTATVLPTSEQLADAGLSPAAGGARLLVAQVPAGRTLTLPAAPRLHVYVARGAFRRSSLAEPLEAGDAFLCTDEPDHDVVAAVDSTVLAWQLDG